MMDMILMLVWQVASSVIANTPPNKVTIDDIGGESNARTIYDEDTGTAGFLN